MNSKTAQWVLIAAVIYFGIGLATWYYNRAQNVRFPVAFPNKWTWALEWPLYQFQK